MKRQNVQQAGNGDLVVNMPVPQWFRDSVLEPLPKDAKWGSRFGYGILLDAKRISSNRWIVLRVRDDGQFMTHVYRESGLDMDFFSGQFFSNLTDAMASFKRRK